MFRLFHINVQATSHTQNSFRLELLPVEAITPVSFPFEPRAYFISAMQSFAPAFTLHPTFSPFSTAHTHVLSITLPHNSPLSVCLFVGRSVHLPATAWGQVLLKKIKIKNKPSFLSHRPTFSARQCVHAGTRKEFRCTGRCKCAIPFSGQTMRMRVMNRIQCSFMSW